MKQSTSNLSFILNQHELGRKYYPLTYNSSEMVQYQRTDLGTLEAPFTFQTICYIYGVKMLSRGFRKGQTSCCLKSRFAIFYSKDSPLVLILLLKSFLLHWSIFRQYLVFPPTSSIFICT